MARVLTSSLWGCKFQKPDFSRNVRNQCLGDCRYWEEDACPYGVEVCGDQVASTADSTLAKMARISCSMASGIMADMVDDIEADILFKTSL